mgnify:CR=1 FL=1
MKYKILAIDDDEKILRLIANTLKVNNFDVETRKNIEEINICDFTGFDLILLDVMMPISGLEICRSIRSQITTPILFLTAKDFEEDLLKGIQAGADDYITKPFGMMEFIARVKAVLRRSSRHGDDRELRCEELSIFPGRHQVYCGNQQVELTRKEFELLLYLMENRGIVMTRDQILCHIWGYDFDGETRTVDVHVRTLRQKLGETGRLVETVRGVGYRMADKGGSQG